MKMKHLWLCFFCCLVVVGCTQAVRSDSPEVSDASRSLVEKEVTAVIHSYMAGYNTARCDDVTPVMKFVRDRMIYVTKSEIVWVPMTDTERELRNMVCGRVSHSGTVDSVTVDVLSPDVAVAAWLYHDEVKLKSGEIKRSKGSALMTLVRSVDGWKITSTMAAYE
jgi:ketosteroid isomerase-like protein